MKFIYQSLSFIHSLIQQRHDVKEGVQQLVKYVTKVFSGKQLLGMHIIHVETVHALIKPFECQTCGKCFGLNGHLRSNTCSQFKELSKLINVNLVAKVMARRELWKTMSKQFMKISYCSFVTYVTTNLGKEMIWKCIWKQFLNK